MQFTNGHVAMRMTLAILTLCLSVVPAVAQSPSPVRPNVVLIVTDDVGYGDLGSYGAQDVKTPSIDSLARDGVRLTDFYAAPQCTPTRAALISGRYQQRSRLEAALPGPKTLAGATGLPATGYSLPQLLKNNGYATGLIGKGISATGRSSARTRTVSITSSGSRADSSIITSTPTATASRTCSRTSRRSTSTVT